MKTVILAGGLGTRMGMTGKEIPKCLLKIGNKTLLELHIDMLKRCGINPYDVVVVIGKVGECWTKENYDKIKSIHKHLIINPINHRTHNTYSLKLALDYIDQDDILIIDGDAFVPKEVINKMITDTRNVLLSKIRDTFIFEGNKIIVDEDGRVINLGRDLLDTKYMYCGVKKIRKEDFPVLKNSLQNSLYYTSDLGILLFNLCKKLYIYNQADNRPININNLEDLKEANKFFLKNFVILMNGYTGVGKSTLALKISEKLNIPLFHSAVIRKELDLNPKTKEDANIFFDFSQKLRDAADRAVYKKLADNAVQMLNEGQNVILDAGYFFSWQRDELYNRIYDVHPELFILRVVCNDEEEIKRRLEERWKNFGKSLLDETPSWNSYVSAKLISEPLEKDNIPPGLIRHIIEHNPLTKKTQFLGDENSLNLIQLLNVLENDDTR